MSAAADAARAVVEAINAAWTAGRPGEIHEHLAEHAVLVDPAGNRLRGREAFVDTYREFVEGGTLHAFDTREWTVDVWEGAAVVAYRFEIVFEFGGARSREAGRDVWVLVDRVDGWRAVWRTLLSEEAEGPAE